MRNAKIIIARYRKGIMTKDQVLNYIKSAYNPTMDAEAISYIMENL